MNPVETTIAGAPFKVHPNGDIEGQFHQISLNLWRHIVGFHRAVSIKHNAESVSYHKWNAKEERYHTLIPFQESVRGGLYVGTNWQDAKNIKLLDEYGEKWGCDFLPACTVHTHVDVDAFESGTDARDEKEAPGWHITLGNLISSSKFTTHFRMRLPMTRRMKEIVMLDSCVNLMPNHLITEVDAEALHKEPGVTNWHQFTSRVQVNGYRNQRTKWPLNGPTQIGAVSDPDQEWFHHGWCH